VSSPVDVFNGSKKTQLKLKDDVTLASLAEQINAQGIKPEAVIVPIEGGVQLRVASTRDEAGKVIKVSPNLMGGEKLQMTQEGVDPGGMGARAYLSQVFPSASVNLGSGLLTITAQRTKSLIPSLIVVAILLAALIALLAIGPTPGAVLRHNAEHDIQASALFYTDLDEMPSLEQRLEQMLDDQKCESR